MVQTHILGFPRMGAQRELKFALESHWAGKSSATELEAIGAELRARHSMESTFMAAKPIADRLAMKERFPDPEHPVVRTHPETGAKALFVNGFTTHFTNYHTAKRVRYGIDANPGGNDLLRYLVMQAMIPEYQMRWHWTPGSVAIWDNRCTQHYAVMDYPPCNRRMHRATIMGDRPV